jgi:hypothetical protein
MPDSLLSRLRSALDALLGRSATALGTTSAAISVTVDDSPGWTPLTSTGPHDRDYAEWLQDQQDALEAWQKNFLVRRIVALTRSYVLGGGISLHSEHRHVDRFLQAFSTHPKTHLASRLGPMVDELTRAGELFPILFTNPVDGISYLRFVPASQIVAIETDPQDYETELRFCEAEPAPGVPGSGTIAGRWWLSPEHPDSWQPAADGSLPPVMLHFAVNRPIGATRGDGDLGPILRWTLRYSNWLEDRVRLNRARTRQMLLDIMVADDAKVAERKRQVETEDPVRAGIYVHGPGETITAHKLEIGADDAEADGLALRLAIAAGANTALHYLGEGAQTNYATAREMGEPSARFYTERQDAFVGFLIDLVTTAYRRAVAVGAYPRVAGDTYKLHASVTETARADNQGLAEAAQLITQALLLMREQGWIDDETAARLAFKFAGEAPLADDVIRKIREGDIEPVTRRTPEGPGPGPGSAPEE